VITSFIQNNELKFKKIETAFKHSSSVFPSPSSTPHTFTARQTIDWKRRAAYLNGTIYNSNRIGFTGLHATVAMCAGFALRAMTDLMLLGILASEMLFWLLCLRMAYWCAKERVIVSIPEKSITASLLGDDSILSNSLSADARSAR